MRYSLIDLLFGIVCVTSGSFLMFLVAPPPPLPQHPPLTWHVEGFACGLGVYLALVYPFYRGLKLYPMLLPRCACCGKYTNGFHVSSGWPRIIFHCPLCEGEFVVWHNGKPGKEETWDKPVLALKWPYALGRYKRMEKPKPDALVVEKQEMSGL